MTSLAKPTSRVAHGAAAELLVCAHFLALGYHVFRAVAATCPVDLMVWLPGEQPRGVEVKAVSRSHAGAGYLNFPTLSNYFWDVLAIVDPDNRVYVLDNDRPPEQLRERFRILQHPVGVLRGVQ